MLKLDGFVAAQRFELKGLAGEDTSHRYLALYEIETDDIDATVEGLTKGAGNMELSTALADPSALVATPISDRVKA